MLWLSWSWSLYSSDCFLSVIYNLFSIHYQFSWIIRRIYVCLTFLLQLYISAQFYCAHWRLCTVASVHLHWNLGLLAIWFLHCNLFSYEAFKWKGFQLQPPGKCKVWFLFLIIFYTMRYLDVKFCTAALVTFHKTEKSI